jgi:hypothetical protein
MSIKVSRNQFIIPEGGSPEATSDEPSPRDQLVAEIFTGSSVDNHVMLAQFTHRKDIPPFFDNPTLSPVQRADAAYNDSWQRMQLTPEHRLALEQAIAAADKAAAASESSPHLQNLEADYAKLAPFANAIDRQALHNQHQEIQQYIDKLSNVDKGRVERAWLLLESDPENPEKAYEAIHNLAAPDQDHPLDQTFVDNLEANARSVTLLRQTRLLNAQIEREQEQSVTTRLRYSSALYGRQLTGHGTPEEVKLVKELLQYIMQKDPSLYGKRSENGKSLTEMVDYYQVTPH